MLCLVLCLTRVSSAEAEFLDAAGNMDMCDRLQPLRRIVQECEQRFWTCMATDKRYSGSAREKVTAQRNDPKVAADIASCRQYTIDNGWRFGVRTWPKKPLRDVLPNKN